MSAFAGKEEELCNVFHLEVDEEYGEHKKTGTTNRFASQDFEELVSLATKGRYYTQLKYHLSKNDAKFCQELKTAENKQIKTSEAHLSSYHRSDIVRSLPPKRNKLDQNSAQKQLYSPDYLPRIHKNVSVASENPYKHKNFYNPSNILISKLPRNKPISHSYIEKLQEENVGNKSIRCLSRESIDTGLSDSLSDSDQNKSDFFLNGRSRHPKSKKYAVGERRNKFKLDIRPQSEFSRVFRELGSISEKTFLANSQLPLETFRSHLLKKYPEEILERIMECFDFTTPIEFGNYVQSLETLINKDIEEAYFLAHRIYDFNNDGKICSQDLFKLFTLSKIYPLLEKDFMKFFMYRQVIPRYPKEKEQPKVDYRKRYYKLNYKQPSYMKEIENKLLTDGNSNYTISMENEFLRKAFKVQRARKKNIVSILNFRKYFADLRLQKKVPTNKVTENYRSLFQFVSSSPKYKPNIQKQIKQNTSTGINTGTGMGEGASIINEAALGMAIDSSNRIPEKNSLHETWTSLEVDVFQMLDIFPNDIPDIVYDILSYLTLVNFSNKTYDILSPLS